MNIVEINRRLREIRAVVDSKGRGEHYPPDMMTKVDRFAEEAKDLISKAGGHPAAIQEIDEAIEIAEKAKKDGKDGEIRQINDAVGSLLLGINTFLNT